MKHSSYNLESNSSNSLMCFTGWGPAEICSMDLNCLTSLMTCGVVLFPPAFSDATSLFSFGADA